MLVRTTRVALVPLLTLVVTHSACLRGSARARDLDRERAKMVQRQIAARGVKDKRVLQAMLAVQRHLFVPERYQHQAYADHPLPIGHQQTISQPYIVAFMTAALKLGKKARVLEIGTGSGYQAAVLAEIAGQVFSIEIVAPLGRRARALLKELGYKNVQVRIGDGYKGWPEKAPFDGIILTACPPRVPEPLLAQLNKDGGVLVAPVGPAGDQKLIRITRTPTGFRRERLMYVRFVPMTGEAQKLK
jgi:protein-L-isoaspartate(D-aspartate) O-methyltransferase